VVGRTRFQSFLAGHPVVGIDTSILIYFVQDHVRYGRRCTELFDRIERGHTSAVTSTLSLLEVLVAPYRLNDEPLAQQFFALLSTYPGLKWIPPTLEIADRAAMIRARYGLKTPDSIQIGTALEQGATAFLGNDKALRKVREIESLLLDDVT